MILLNNTESKGDEMNIRWCLVILIAGLLSACSGTDKPSVISAAELMARINNQSAPIILDVRTEQEYQQSHVPGAINIPYDNYSSGVDRLQLKPNEEIVVYCESGARASKVELALKQQGFFE